MKYYKTEKICAKEIGVEFDENGKITEIEILMDFKILS